MASVESPIGAVLPHEVATAENPDADPELDAWQADRWAPHPLVPEVGESFAHRTDDDSFHARSVKQAEPVKRGRRS